MPSKPPKFKCVKFTGVKTKRKLFNVVFSKSKPNRQTPHFKPRFFTKKNLFFVKNCKKYTKKNKAQLKFNFIDNKKKIMARRLRKENCLFITHKHKKLINSSEDKKIIPPKLDEKSINKIPTSKEKPKFNNIKKNLNNNNNNNSNPIISQFRQISKIQNNTNINNNLTFSEEDNILSCNNNTSSKPNQEKSTNANGRWHLSEHKKFLEAIIKYGNDWKKVEKHIGTRNSSQARSHAQKFFIKLKEEQKQSKISKEIDFSNSTVQSFFEKLQNMEQEKRENIIKELENVVFDKQTTNRRKKRNKVNSETYTDGFLSGTEFMEEYNFLFEEKNRKMSIDSLGEKRDKRKFIEERNDMFTDEEYEKSFHKVFIEKEVQVVVQSRKQSLEDDFMFNINI